jgi:hypothetical protein
VDVPVIVHQNLFDSPRDPRTDLVGVPRRIGVIRSLVSGSVLPLTVSKEEDDQKDRSSDEEQFHRHLTLLRSWLTLRTFALTFIRIFIGRLFLITCFILVIFRHKMFSAPTHGDTDSF